MVWFEFMIMMRFSFNEMNIKIGKVKLQALY